MSTGRSAGGAPMRGLAGGSLAFLVIVIIIIALGASTTRFAQVDEGQRGVIITQGAVEGVQEPGIFFRAFAPFTRVEIIEVRRKTREVSQNVASSDKQLYDIKIQVDFSRLTTPAALKGSYGSIGVRDENLIAFLDGFVNDALKSASTQYTLDEVLADRGGLSNRITQILTSGTEDRPSPADQLFVRIDAVKVLDIVVSEEYARLLSEKSNLEVQIETEERRRQQIEAQQANNLFQAEQEAKVALTTEQGRTAAALEAAGRDAQVRAIQGKYWRENPELFELRQRELMVEMLQGGNLWFVDPNTNLTLLLNQMATGSMDIVPVPQPATPAEPGTPAQPTAPTDPNAPVQPAP
ncbi:MAG: SPFH domain-containing protein [Chloroflexi bacterium]|nr:SPFH domain-containing protein [Chloroflexota bacterium]